MQLSKNFWLREFLWSEKAARMGRVVEAPPDIVGNLQYLCTSTLQPIRDALCSRYGKDMPIDVSSGYRPQWLNTAVGGSQKSDHMLGLAADFGCPYLSDLELASFIASMVDQLPIKDLGYEFDSWVHLGVSKPWQYPDREIWTARKQLKDGEMKTVYLKGLVAK